MLNASISLYLLSIFLGSLFLRYVYLVRRSLLKQAKHDPPLKRTKPCRTAIVLGSGGHTSEMMRIIEGLKAAHYSPRLYLAASGDEMSLQKLKAFETSNGTFETAAVQVRTIPRARQVLQSYFTSIFTTLRAILSSFSIVLSFRPDLVLCNGPGTCIPICLCAYLMKFLFLKDVTIMYVESLCRVQKLSLSGIILYRLYIADYIFVQWPRLKELYHRTQYFGRVM